LLLGRVRPWLLLLLWWVTPSLLGWVPSLRWGAAPWLLLLRVPPGLLGRVGSCWRT
jgi:hypothetical protein